MDGMQYIKNSFTLPAGGKDIDQARWDLAFLTKKEFMKKYSCSSMYYDTMTDTKGLVPVKE